MTVSDLLEQPCKKSDNINKVVYKLLTACSKLVYNLGQAVRTQLVDGLLADLLQDARFFCVYLTRVGKALQSNPVFRCEQHCNIVMQYCNIDQLIVIANCNRREQIAIFTYGITVNVPFKLPPEIGPTPTTLLSGQGQTQGLGQSNIYHSCEGVSKS
jgi:hypothetical protein